MRYILNTVFYREYYVYLPGYNAVYSVKVGSKQSRRPTCFHAGILLCLFFDPEDGGDMFLRNVGRLSTDYTALYPRRKYSS
jgi:hypothetical protein